MAKPTKPDRGVSRFSETKALAADEWVFSENNADRLLISENLYEATILKLAERSDGRRESAAIWAGTITGDDAIVSQVYFHHELCDDRGSALSLELTERAKFDLYRRLASLDLKLIALIHTHPENWVGLSPIDKRNQICSRIGFWSLVIPWYARTPMQHEDIGVHIRADVGWQRVPRERVNKHLIITSEI